MKLSPEETALCVEALRERGDDLRRYAVRDGDDLRVRGEAMHRLARKLELAQDEADTQAALSDVRGGEVDDAG